VQSQKTKTVSNNNTQGQWRDMSDPCHRPPSINKNKLGPFAYPKSDAESNSDDDIFMLRPYYAVRTIIHDVQTTTVCTTMTYNLPTSATPCPKSPVSPAIAGLYGSRQTLTSPTTTPPMTSSEDQIQDLNNHCTDTYKPMLCDNTDDLSTRGLAQG
jgi:hypothetical protein